MVGLCKSRLALQPHVVFMIACAMLAGPVRAAEAQASACVAVAARDRTCDGVDDDCDGTVDDECGLRVFDCPAGSRVVVGTAGTDWLIGMAGADCILGLGGDDWIWGMAGNDVLSGGSGQDLIVGGLGTDRLLGEGGDDLLFGGSGNDSLEGGEGNDVLDGESGSNVAHGGACNDVLVGAWSTDTLYGDAGADVLFNPSAGVLDGGEGFDSCNGTCEIAADPEQVVCGSDADCAAGQRCVPGSGLCVSPQLVSFSDTVCDDSDDDCDGRTDEEFAPSTTRCGVGACSRTGQTACTRGLTRDLCVPGAPAANDATCDGVDDDCDGVADDDFQPQCTLTGVTACTLGVVTELSCSDGDACSTDSCEAGACVRVARVCDDGNVCTADSCDSASGCTFAPRQGSCDDGNACTLADACNDSGGCNGAPVPVDDANPCTEDSCDPELGLLHTVAVGRACDDGDACTVSDSCDATAACAPGTPRQCDDGQYCNGSEACDATEGCIAGIAPSVDDGVTCTADTCDEQLDLIVHAPSHGTCDDGLFCNGVEQCDVAADCVEGSAPLVDDGIACTLDRCDEATASVIHVGDAAACDDQDACNGAETCAPGAGCVAGIPAAVDDENACTADACDAVAGVTHTPTAVGTLCGSGDYCDGRGNCLVFAPCAGNLVLAAGQTRTFTGPCSIDSVSFQGGTLTVDGALKLAAVTLNSGGSLRVVGGDLFSNAVTVSNGSVSVDGSVIGSVTQSGGSIRVGGTLSIEQPAGFSLSGGTFTSEGVVRLPRFDGSVVSGGTFVNRGRLDIASDALEVAAAVTLSEAGSLGADDRVGSLILDGRLTHPRGHAAGVSFAVSGDAIVRSGGVIDVSGMGLRGGRADGNAPAAGETFAADWATIVPAATGPLGIGGSYGGLGGNAVASTYGVAPLAELLGSGGSTASGCSSASGNGGGRIDLTVDGTLQVDGAVRANGADGAGGQCSGGGSGGSIRLQVGSLAGAGNITASGGAGYDAGGSGGRISLHYELRLHGGLVNALGGFSSRPGSAGTVYLEDTQVGSVEVRIDNAGVAAITPLHAPDVAGARLRVLSGSVLLVSGASPASLILSSGVVEVPGTLELGAGALQMTGGTLVNTGTLRLATFDAAAVSGGTLINRGRLDIASDVLLVAAGVTLNESGSLGATDSVGTLTVNGRITHDRGYPSGVSFTVTGDAHVGSSGTIDANGMGLRGGRAEGNTAWGGETYALNQQDVVLGPFGPVGIGGSHGGLGGNALLGTYGSALNPQQLGSGGSMQLGCVGAGGNGGGRVNLVVQGTLSLAGAIRAHGGNGYNRQCSGGGSGGSLRLRANTFTGGGSLGANGGNGYSAGGGGGRIAVESSQSTFTGVALVNGGTGTRPGAAGTVENVPISVE